MGACYMEIKGELWSVKNFLATVPGSKELWTPQNKFIK